MGKIPDLPGKIRNLKRDNGEYVRYLKNRTYHPDKQYTETDWVLIGKRIDEMPGLMIPNDNYEEIFRGAEAEAEADETMTAEEERYIRDNSTYGMYNLFFTALYNEFRQQTRRNGERRVNPYKAEHINKVLAPLREMMKGERYAELLGLVEGPEGEGEEEALS